MNKITWFGYKIHLAVDTASELPIAIEITPANINDGDMGPVLVEKVASQMEWLGVLLQTMEWL